MPCGSTHTQTSHTHTHTHTQKEKEKEKGGNGWVWKRNGIGFDGIRVYRIRRGRVGRRRRCRCPPWPPALPDSACSSRWCLAKDNETKLLQTNKQTNKQTNTHTQVRRQRFSIRRPFPFQVSVLISRLVLCCHSVKSDFFWPKQYSALLPARKKVNEISVFSVICLFCFVFLFFFKRAWKKRDALELAVKLARAANPGSVAGLMSAAAALPLAPPRPPRPAWFCRLARLCRAARCNKPKNGVIVGYSELQWVSIGLQQVKWVKKNGFECVKMGFNRFSTG